MKMITLSITLLSAAIFLDQSSVLVLLTSFPFFFGCFTFYLRAYIKSPDVVSKGKSRDEVYEEYKLGLLSSIQVQGFYDAEKEINEMFIDVRNRKAKFASLGHSFFSSYIMVFFTANYVELVPFLSLNIYAVSLLLISGYVLFGLIFRGFMRTRKEIKY